MRRASTPRADRPALIHFSPNEQIRREMDALISAAPPGLSPVVLMLSTRRTVAHGSTKRYRGQMTAQPEINQRDLRMRSKEIMDAVEHGQSFTVTRDGREIGELVPLRRRRQFVPRAEFAATSRCAPTFDVAAFRADQDATFEQVADDPYAR